MAAKKLAVVPQSVCGSIVHQRVKDGYVNATAMCKAGGKEWSSYWRSAKAQEDADAVSRSLHIGRDLLVQSITTGKNEIRGTWVHPHIALDLAMWISSEFKADVLKWLFEYLKGRAGKKHTEIRQTSIETRKEFTAVLKRQGVQGDGYRITTNEIYRGTWGADAAGLREQHGLKHGANLREHMSALGLGQMIIAEHLAAGQISEMDIRGNKSCADAAFSAASHIRSAILDYKRGYKEQKRIVASTKGKRRDESR